VHRALVVSRVSLTRDCSTDFWNVFDFFLSLVTHSDFVCMKGERIRREIGRGFISCRPGGGLPFLSFFFLVGLCLVCSNRLSRFDL
jgi:hypothetical protein